MVSAGPTHCLALLEDGSVFGWGHNGWGRNSCKWPPQLGGRATAVAAGGGHSLAVLEDGCVAGWGHNLRWQAKAPERVQQIGAQTVVAGMAFSAALLYNGEVVCWGCEDAVPANLRPVKTLAAGAMHLVALQRDGTVAAWGKNSHGETSVPKINDAVVAVAAGTDRSLAVTARGLIYAWGANSYGEHAPPTPEEIHRRHPNAKPVAVACGVRHAVALLDNGKVVAWGSNDKNQLQVPAIPPACAVTGVAAGNFYSIALLSSGDVVCWGDDEHGQCSSKPCFGPLRVVSGLPSKAARVQHRKGLIVFLLWQARLSSASPRLLKSQTGELIRLLPRDMLLVVARFALSWLEAPSQAAHSQMSAAPKPKDPFCSVQ
ncbi:putative E3 ubiquitin-protein ligase HERC2 [Diplonema papillatum]|nr:putative E3 ubiquitin-protein ligase HERC2 [Diplonema papillatum]